MAVNRPGQRFAQDIVRMSRKTVDAVIERLVEHCERYPDLRIIVTLHGGEPMMFGMPGITYLVTQLYERIGRDRVCVTMQCNGALITPRNAAQLAELGVDVGVSIDGLPSAHDRFRPLLTGGGTHAKALKGFNALLAEGALTKWLCVVHPEVDPETGEWVPDVDPVATTDYLLSLGAPQGDYLLPHVTHDHPIDRMDLFAPWLMAAAARYWPRASPGNTYLRMFEEMLRATMGGCESSTMGWGLVQGPLIVDYEGWYRHHDSLSVTRVPDIDLLRWPFNSLPGMTQGQTMNVKDTPVYLAGLASMRQNRIWGVQHRMPDQRPVLCDTCMACPLVRQCGGGLFSHRYSSHNDPARHLVKGFVNPSGWCKTLYTMLEWHRMLYVSAASAAGQRIRTPRGWGIDEYTPEALAAARIIQEREHMNTLH